MEVDFDCSLTKKPWARKEGSNRDPSQGSGSVRLQRLGTHSAVALHAGEMNGGMPDAYI